MSLSVTRTISSPTVALTPRAREACQNEPSDNERECWSICRDRFKYVILLSVAIQYFLLMLCSIILNISYLHPVKLTKEIFSITFSPLMLVVVIHGYFKLKPLVEEKFYNATRMSKFIRSFSHESTIFFLNVFIGLFTSMLFIRYLQEDFKTLTIKTEEKRFLNEKYAFLILNGAFTRCYFYFKQRDFDHSVSFSMVHQSKFLQFRRQIAIVLKSSYIKSMLPTFHYLGFYIIFGGSFCFLLRRVLMMNVEDTSILDSFMILLSPRLIIYSWILSSLIWSSMELISSLISIFATEPKEFPIEGGALTLSDALALTKFQITQQLAAQDLYSLSDHPNNLRRKQFYALSNPGGHPHNWKNLVQKSLEIINRFTGELKTTLESSNKIINNLKSTNFNQTIYQFYEGKRLVREHNNFSGIRSLATSPMKFEAAKPEEKQPNYVDKLKQKMMSNRFVFYFLGESEVAKFNFLLKQNSQTIMWITQGISAIIARSIQEDSYGVVQHDLKQIIKSFIKLKSLLDKLGTINSIAKDRDFLALKAAVRRSLYRIVSEFSRFFDDLLLDSEDIRALQTFVNFKEL